MIYLNFNNEEVAHDDSMVLLEWLTEIAEEFYEEFDATATAFEIACILLVEGIYRDNNGEWDDELLIIVIGNEESSEEYYDDMD